MIRSWNSTAEGVDVHLTLPLVCPSCNANLEEKVAVEPVMTPVHALPQPHLEPEARIQAPIALPPPPPLPTPIVQAPVAITIDPSVYLELGELRAQVALFRPAFDRETARLEQSKNTNRIGVDGENWAFESISMLLAGHAVVTDTSSQALAGDLQVLYQMCNKSADEPPLLITVESKHSECTPLPIISKRFLTQAQAQVQAQNSDAGILLYTGPLGMGQLIQIKQAERLVVVGNCREPGQLFSGMLCALMIAVEHRKSTQQEDDGDLRLTTGEACKVRHVLSETLKLAGDARRTLNKVKQIVTAESKHHRTQAVGIIDLAHRLNPDLVSKFIPPSVVSVLSVPYERLESNPTSSKKRKKMKRMEMGNIFCDLNES